MKIKTTTPAGVSPSDLLQRQRTAANKAKHCAEIDPAMNEVRTYQQKHFRTPAQSTTSNWPVSFKIQDVAALRSA